MTPSNVVHANLERVFNERDADRRRQAIQELYAADAVLFEPDARYAGAAAIAGAVGHLIAALPPTLTFVMVAPAMVNHGMAKLRWRGQLPDGTVIVTGTDVAEIDNGQIQTIHVFVDRPA